MYNEAVEVYVRALLDIAAMLEPHREARSAFDPKFLFRVVRDGFLQTVTEQDLHRVLYENYPGEEFLLWHGKVPGVKMNWNTVGWIFPFATPQEMDNSYEIITRARLAEKSWASVRQFWLSCRLRFQETALDIPTNIVKVRVMGKDCRKAMRILEQHPPNLRYIAKTLRERATSTSYLQSQIRLKMVIGERLAPYVEAPQ